MTAKTIDEYLAQSGHHEHYHALIREGWKAAMNRPRWECTDCALGTEEGPCIAPCDSDGLRPTDCPYGAETDCNWVLYQPEQGDAT